MPYRKLIPLCLAANIGITTGLYLIFISLPLMSLYSAIQLGGIAVNKVSIVEVIPNTPAATANLKPGDILVSVNEKTINTPFDFINATNDHAGEMISITINRDGINKSIELTPRTVAPYGQGRVGMNLSKTALEKRPLRTLLPEIVAQGYSGNEIKEPVFIPGYPYQDTSLSRLRLLITGLTSLSIGALAVIYLFTQRKLLK